MTKLPITTTTVIVEFTELIDIWGFFDLMNIYRNNPDNIPHKKYVKLHPGEPGLFLASKFSKIYRGSKSKKGCFGNSIILTLSGTEKNLSLKIFSDKLTIYGATNYVHIYEASKLVIDAIKDSQDKIDWIKNNNAEAVEIAQWIADNSYVIRQYFNVFDDENVDMEFCQEMSIKDPIDFWAEYEKTDLFLSLKSSSKGNSIAKYLIESSQDYETQEDYCKYLNRCINYKSPKTVNLDIRGIRFSMVNHNTVTGYCITIRKLLQVFMDFDDYIVNYDNTKDDAVTIKLPYILTEKMKRKIHIKETNKCEVKFKVSKTGSITTIGPHKDINEILYEKFIADLNSVQDFIRDPDSGRKPNVKKTKPEFTIKSRSKYYMDEEILMRDYLRYLDEDLPLSTNGSEVEENNFTNETIFNGGDSIPWDSM